MKRKDKFSIEIEKLKLVMPEISYISLIADYCKDNEIELEIVPKLINKTLKEKIENESKKLILIVDDEKEKNKKAPLNF